MHNRRTVAVVCLIQYSILFLLGNRKTILRFPALNSILLAFSRTGKHSLVYGGGGGGAAAAAASRDYWIFLVLFF